MATGNSPEKREAEFLLALATAEKGTWWGSNCLYHTCTRIHIHTYTSANTHTSRRLKEFTQNW